MRPFEATALPLSIRVLAAEVGEPPACLLDDHLHRCEIPLLHAGPVEGAVDSSLPRSACTTRSPRTRVHARLAARAPAPSFSIANESTEFSMVAIAETRMRSPFANAPAPRSAHQRRASAGADTTPSRTTPSDSSAMSVAQTGMPRE